jgi:hypothetical protein
MIAPYRPRDMHRRRQSVLKRGNRMPAFALKHMVDERGPLASMMKTVRKAPYSYTSKEPEASQAAYGHYIYVIEVRTESKSVRSYWLGYKYRAYEKHMRAGGAPWPGNFKFKNAGRPATVSEGVYFDAPVKLTDTQVTDWLREKQQGMVEIPAPMVALLETVIKNPEHGAQAFA